MEKTLSEYVTLSKNLDDLKFSNKLKVGILSSFTLNGLNETLHVKCSELDIGYQSYVADYNQYNQEILNSNSNLYKFSPDITFLILDIRSFLGDYFYFPYSISSDERKSITKEKIAELENLISHFQNSTNSKLVITNFNVPSFSPNGIIETKSEFGFHEMIQEINIELRRKIKNLNSIYIFDYNRFVSKYGEKNIFNERQFHVGNIQIEFDYIPFLAHELMSYIKPMYSSNRKCIVLDLDNTLWGGILGEDGFDGIELGHTSTGKAFVEFQKYLLSLWEQGIILTINSKNNYDDVMKVIHDHPDMILREKHFASMQINWYDKAENMQKISDELNIGLNSFVFFDDDKINQERIKTEFPEILTIALDPDPSTYAEKLKDLNDFNVLQRTKEDSKRGEMYSQQRQRNELERSVSNLDDFLKKLNIKVQIQNITEFNIPRISQLTLKTNQFNLTTKRYQESDIRRLAQDPKMKIGCAQVQDKFGDNGITSVFIVEKNEKEWKIDSFLQSCRIIGRGIEDAIMSEILKDAKQNNVEKVYANFIPTNKNKPAEEFLPQFGFKKENDLWVFNLSDPIKSPQHLFIEVGDV